MAVGKEKNLGGCWTSKVISNPKNNPESEAEEVGSQSLAGGAGEQDRKRGILNPSPESRRKKKEQKK